MTQMVSRRMQAALALLSLAAIACGGGPARDGAGSDGNGDSSDSGDNDGGDGRGAEGDPGSGRNPGGTSDGAVVRSSGCGRAPLSSGPSTIEVDGVERTFIVDLPDDYDRDTAYPLLFGFHGRGFSAAEFRSAGYGNLLSAAADAAIVVHPDALGDPERYWDTESLDDVRFFDALLEKLEETSCVDESRVFATGHSSGGYFVNTLACVRGDALRAIAPVAGGGPFDSSDEPCEGPVSAWIAHAEDDETVLFENGENSRDFWLDRDSCDQERFDRVAPAPCVAYEGCSAGLAVNWCVYDGGHDWPTFAARGIWSFFARF